MQMYFKLNEFIIRTNFVWKWYVFLWKFIWPYRFKIRYEIDINEPPGPLYTSDTNGYSYKWGNQGPWDEII